MLPRPPLPRPALLLAPLAFAPTRPRDAAVGAAASLVLREALDQGDLDALEGLAVSVELERPALVLTLTVRGRAIRPARGEPVAVTVRARCEDLVRVAAGRVDPDTLFFQRRLTVSGDTALGVMVKNTLDGVALNALPTCAVAVLDQLADAIPETGDAFPPSSSP